MRLPPKKLLATLTNGLKKAQNCAVSPFHLFSASLAFLFLLQRSVGADVKRIWTY
jgi:hypothetical protein